jgi:hypothetical protein
MSLIVYEVLTAQPDFTDAPAFGIDDDRDTTNSPGGRAFAAWTGHTDRVLRFDFQTTTAEEWRNLREFIDRMGRGILRAELAARFRAGRRCRSR